jgi:hypothetical protein
MAKVFLVIYEYFSNQEMGLKRLRTENLFKVKGENKEVDKLEKNIALGNYKYLLELESPYIVATYFKSIFKCMGESLCRFHFYDKFKTISKLISPQ